VPEAGIQWGENHRIRATFHAGTCVPHQPYELPEGANVDLLIENPTLLPPQVSDPQERARRSSELVENIRRHPLTVDASHLTREELHDRC